MCVMTSTTLGTAAMETSKKVDTSFGEQSSLKFKSHKIYLSFGLFAVSVLAFLHIWRVLDMLGMSVEIENHSPGQCRSIPPIECGAEDIAVTSSGLAFISSGLRTFAACDPEKMSGKVYLFDFNKPYRNVIELAITGKFDYKSFIPHGLGLYENQQNNEIQLYIVNHANPHQDTVEVFTYLHGNRSLIFRKTIVHKYLKNLNDVVLVGKDDFYATNDRYFHHPIGYLPELILMRSWGNVVHYKSGKVNIVADSLYLPNGINIAPDKKYLYVMETLRQRVVALKLKDNDKIGPVRIIPIATFGDNIEVDHRSGDLYIGSAVNFYKLLLKKNKGPSRSLTQVTKVSMYGEEIDSANLTVSELYGNDGSEISGGSVAAHYNGQLLIGSVFHKLLHCQVTDHLESVHHAGQYVLKS